MRARLLASAVVLFVGSVALATAGSDTKMPFLGKALRLFAENTRSVDVVFQNLTPVAQIHALRKGDIDAGSRKKSKEPRREQRRNPHRGISRAR